MRKLLWMDLETTGLSVDEDDIIEVGMAVTDQRLDVLDTYEEVVRPTRRGFARIEGNDVVHGMHEGSGLLDLLDSGQAAAVVEREMHDFVDEHFGIDSTGVLPAGSGFDRFDRVFLQVYWPVFESRLHYGAVDLGGFRRLVDTFDIVALKDCWREPAIPHRALEDVLAMVDTCAELVNTLGWRGPEPSW